MGRYSEGFLFRRFDHKDYYHITNPNLKKLTLNPRVLARSATLAYSEYRAADRACIANARAVGPGCIFRIENLRNIEQVPITQCSQSFHRNFSSIFCIIFVLSLKSWNKEYLQRHNLLLHCYIANSCVYIYYSHIYCLYPSCFVDCFYSNCSNNKLLSGVHSHS